MPKFTKHLTIIFLSLVVFADSKVFGSDLIGQSNTKALKTKSKSMQSNDALNLYNQKQYAAAAFAFEDVIRTSSPNPTLYYYAALANQQSGKGSKSKSII